jgi:SAM-dependent methyltransferase
MRTDDATRQPDAAFLEPRAINPKSATDFDAAYTSSPVWDIGFPQPAFQALATAGAIRGRVVDVGCGTGEHALMAAALGCEATGVDLAQTGIALARAKALERGLNVRFEVLDALQLPTLGEQFDTGLDSGLFHVLDPATRIEFAHALRAVMRTGGRYYILCFSDQQPGTWGPFRISQEEIRNTFHAGWAVESIEPSRFQVRTLPGGAHAWLVRLFAQ